MKLLISGQDKAKKRKKLHGRANSAKVGRRSTGFLLES